VVISRIGDRESIPVAKVVPMSCTRVIPNPIISGYNPFSELFQRAMKLRSY
jgi:hypothetical protein